MPENHLLWIAREFGDPGYVPLTVQDLEALESVTEFARFGSGARIYEEGTDADACYLVRSGSVRIVRERVRPRINLASIGPGQMIGDYSMFRSGVHASTALAMSPVEALRFERRRTMDALAMHPRIGLRWMVEALGRLEVAHERVSMILRGSVMARVAAFLISHNGSGSIEITHEGLAEMIGAERASVSRAISALRSDGAIASSRGSISVLDVDHLHRIADSGPDRKSTPVS